MSSGEGGPRRCGHFHTADATGEDATGEDATGEDATMDVSDDKATARQSVGFALSEESRADYSVYTLSEKQGLVKVVAFFLVGYTQCVCSQHLAPPLAQIPLATSSKRG